MSLCAIIAIDLLHYANTTLEENGFGPDNFSVVAYSEGGASHAALHTWDNASFASTVKALDGVIWEEGDGDPITQIQTLIEAQNASWGARIPELPDSGTVTADEIYRRDDTLYQVLVTHSRDTWGGDPEQWPTYIRRIRKPGEVRPWEAVRGRFDAYWLVNPFTGQPDECLYPDADGEVYVVSAGNAAGTNTWPPAGAGSYGWVLKTPTVDEYPPFKQPMAGDPPYMTGAKVTSTVSGWRYICNRDNVTHCPEAWPAAWNKVT